jgi:hypothetical protein
MQDLRTDTPYEQANRETEMTGIENAERGTSFARIRKV